MDYQFQGASVIRLIKESSLYLRTKEQAYNIFPNRCIIYTTKYLCYNPDMVVRSYDTKSFSILVTDKGRLLVKTQLISYRLQGMNNNFRQIDLIEEEASKGNINSLSDLVSLFFIEEDEWTKRQIIEMVPVRMIEHV